MRWRGARDSGVRIVRGVSDPGDGAVRGMEMLTMRGRFAYGYGEEGAAGFGGDALYAGEVVAEYGGLEEGGGFVCGGGEG